MRYCSREGASPKPDESRREMRPPTSLHPMYSSTPMYPMYPSKYRHHHLHSVFSHHITMKTLIATQPVGHHIMITSGPYDRSDLPTWAMYCACPSAIGTDQQRRLASGPHEPPLLESVMGLTPHSALVQLHLMGQLAAIGSPT